MNKQEFKPMSDDEKRHVREWFEESIGLGSFGLTLAEGRPLECFGDTDWPEWVSLALMHDQCEADLSDVLDGVNPIVFAVIAQEMGLVLDKKRKTVFDRATGKYKRLTLWRTVCREAMQEELRDRRAMA